MKHLQKTNILLYICLCIPAIFFVFNPAKFPSDDGFFYPQIAYNIVHGKGSYFNDLYLTNGYHPLWMLFCVFAELINPFGKQNVVFIIWMFQVMLVLLSFKKLDIFFQNNLQGKIIAYFAITLLFFSLGTLYLIEAHLNLFCFSLLLTFLASGKKNDWAFGAFFSAVFLSRLDNIFPLMALSLYYFASRKWDYRLFFKSGLIILFFCGGYMLSNWYWFGNLVPVSGRIKSAFPEINKSIHVNFTSLFFLSATLFYIVFVTINKHCSYRLLKLTFSSGAILQLLYNLFFQSQIGQWYYVAQILVLAFLICDLSSLILKKVNEKMFFNYVLVFFGLVVTSSVGYMKAKSNFSLQNNFFSKDSTEEKNKDGIQKLAEELKDKLPRNARVFTYDFPGKLAFYSDLDIIPADGLVANKTYFSDITKLDFETFLRKSKINYIILPSAFTGDDVPYYLGLSVTLDKKQPIYSLRNPLTKKIIFPIKTDNFTLLGSYANPVKTYQKDYDSVSVYKIR